MKTANAKRALVDEYVERVQNALTLDGKFVELADEDYLSALDQLSDEIASMIEAKREEMKVTE